MQDSTRKPTALVTNDDGIQSAFLWVLVNALSQHFDVTIVAPDGERSWTGRGFTRHGSLSLHPWDEHAAAWSLSGTPTDCVNIGATRLMPQQPDVVVSGINLGFNMSLPLVLTSGTVAGALEAALLGYRAIASSLHIPFEQFDAVRANKGEVDGTLRDSLEAAADRTATYAMNLLATPPNGVVVHNLNFPSNMDSNTPMDTVKLADLRLGAMYTRRDENTFEFEFPRDRQLKPSSSPTDFDALQKEHASVSILDYSQLSR